MDKLEVKVVVESRFKELGANKLSLQPSGDCWTLNGEFFRVCLLFPELSLKHSLTQNFPSLPTASIFSYSVSSFIFYILKAEYNEILYWSVQ